MARRAARRSEGRHGVEELREPAARVHPILGSRPAAELLPIVHEHGERSARGPEVAQVRGDRGGRFEGDEIAEALIDGEQGDSPAPAFSPERRVQLVPLEPAHEKVAAVEGEGTPPRPGPRPRHNPAPPPPPWTQPPTT